MAKFDRRLVIHPDIELALGVAAAAAYVERHQGKKEPGFSNGVIYTMTDGSRLYVYHTKMTVVVRSAGRE
jgi:hypothetical protein